LSQLPSWLFGAGIPQAMAVRKHNSTDACDKELEELKEALTKLCVKHSSHSYGICGKDAAAQWAHSVGRLTCSDVAVKSSV